MLGPAKSRRLDQQIAVLFEALVPDDYLYRHLEATPDLGARRPALFTEADCTCDAERDEYFCLQHHPVKRETSSTGRR